MSKSFIYTIAGILVVSLAIFGVLFVVNKNKDAVALAVQESALNKNFILAKDKLSKAKDTLSNMTDGLSGYFAFGVGVQDQIKKATTAAKKTDFLFTDPNGNNPQFIVKNLANGKLLNDERKAINVLLEEWQKKTDFLYLGKIDINEAEKIKQDAQKIKTFIEDIQKAVNSLTPENSGLSQVQINIYKEQLPSTSEIDNIIDSISVAIIVQSPKGNPIAFQSSADSNTGGDTGGNVGPNHPPTPPPFTPEEIIAQEQLVAQYQGEVDTIQKQLDKVEEQIQQVLPPAPTPPTPPETPPPPEAQPESGGVINAGVHRVIIPTTGIIIQPGPPRLIQGIDQY